MLTLLSLTLDQHRNPSDALAMAAYMKNQFPFFGIKKPLRQELSKAFLREVRTGEELKAVVQELWKKDEREFQYVGLDLLRKASKKQLALDDLEWIEELVRTKSWWDTVDALASPIIGNILLKYTPKERADYSQRWIKSEYMWLQRVAILFQLRYKAATNEALLFRYCQAQATNPDFFIRKAIGWALREYAKTNALAVENFIEHTPSLSPLSAREGLKWLKKKGR